MAGYRFCTLLSAAISAFLMAWSIFFLIEALVEYRTDDFVTGTETIDFDAEGTCVETITKAQLDIKKYHEEGDDADCNNGKQDEVARSLMASVHGIYYVWNELYVAKGVTNSADSTGAPNGWSGWDSNNKYTYGTVARSVLSAVAGGSANGCSLCEVAAGGTALESGQRNGDQIYPPINYTDAYEALLKVAEYESVPVNCDTIYNYNSQTLDDPSSQSVRAKRFMQALVEESEGDAALWPLGKLSIDCNTNDGDPSPEGKYEVGYAIEHDMVISDQQKLYLYAHCLAQFRYASVGTPVPDGGALGLPIPGNKAGPLDWALYNDPIPGLQDLTNSWIGKNYTTRVRIYQGQRFGFAVWAYVPMILTSSYLCADAIILFVAEAMAPMVREENKSLDENQTKVLVFIILRRATSLLLRQLRFAIGLVALIVSLVCWILYSVVPWGLYENRMPRPICEQRSGMGADTDYSGGFITSMFYQDSRGG